MFDKNTRVDEKLEYIYYDIMKYYSLFEFDGMNGLLKLKFLPNNINSPFELPYWQKIKIDFIKEIINNILIEKEKRK